MYDENLLYILRYSYNRFICFYFLCVSVLPVCMHVCVLCACLVPNERVHEHVSDPLKLELEMVESGLVGAMTLNPLEEQSILL